MSGDSKGTASVGGSISIHIDLVRWLPAEAGLNLCVAGGAPVDATVVAAQVRDITGPGCRRRSGSAPADFLALGPALERAVGLGRGCLRLEVRLGHRQRDPV